MNAPKYTQGQAVTITRPDGTKVQGKVVGLSSIPFFGWTYTVEYPKVITEKVKEEDLSV